MKHAKYAGGRELAGVKVLWYSRANAHDVVVVIGVSGSQVSRDLYGQPAHARSRVEGFNVPGSRELSEEEAEALIAASCSASHG